MQIENKYDCPKAVEMRKDLNALGEKLSALQYQLFLTNKELSEKQKVYLEFLGVVKEEKKDEKLEVKDGC